MHCSEPKIINQSCPRSEMKDAQSSICARKTVLDLSLKHTVENTSNLQGCETFHIPLDQDRDPGACTEQKKRRRMVEAVMTSENWNMLVHIFCRL